jgi:vacuolar iron transporter family protein
MEISPELHRQLLVFQRNEITEYHIYTRLAKSIKSAQNQHILEGIAKDELGHYQLWKKYTRQEVKPDRFKLWFYYLISRVFGYTFGIKLMERGEEDAQSNYRLLKGKVEEIDEFLEDENEHEQALIELLDEESLRYAGSIVLGLNDALVELTGALAGLTLALQNTQLIALSGLITGIAAALSMGASEYLSTRSEETEKHPLKASLYTGVAYIFTVTILILPYLLLDNYYICLAFALIAAVLIIAVFNYYISVAKDEPFRRRFLEMASLSLGVAAFSFILGYFIRSALGVDCGRVINPLTASGQVEGGMAQALGFALYEDMLFDEQGRLTNARFGPYRLLKADEMPVMDVIFVQTLEPSGPFGAKSVAEISIDGVAPALVSAIHDAVGVWVSELPVSADYVLSEMRKNSAKREVPNLHQESA